MQTVVVERLEMQRLVGRRSDHLQLEQVVATLEGGAGKIAAASNRLHSDRNFPGHA